MSVYGVILFYTTSAALKAEKLLTRAGHEVDLVPAPREYSHDCAVAIRIDWDDAGKAEALVEEVGIETGGIKLWNEG